MFLCDSLSSEHSHSIQGNQAYWRPTSEKGKFSVKVGAHNEDKVSGKVPEIFRLWGQGLYEN